MAETRQLWGRAAWWCEQRNPARIADTSTALACFPVLRILPCSKSATPLRQIRVLVVPLANRPAETASGSTRSPYGSRRDQTHDDARVVSRTLPSGGQPPQIGLKQ